MTNFRITPTNHRKAAINWRRVTSPEPYIILAARERSLPLPPSRKPSLGSTTVLIHLLNSNTNNKTGHNYTVKIYKNIHCTIEDFLCFLKDDNSGIRLIINGVAAVDEEEHMVLFTARVKGSQVN